MSISILSENCQYRAEGNAGIVIRLVKEGTVLRLKKQDNAAILTKSPSEVFKELESEIKIITDVLKPIVGKSFVNIPVLVFLRAEEIKILNETITRFRPAHRMHKSVKNEDTYVFMLPDYCSLPRSLDFLPTCGSVLSVEIKMKQGFTKEEFLPSSISPLPLPQCRFCMMQEIKLKKGVTSSKSGYCPCDLFSGCYDQMVHALKMLLETPQNNLRIFMNEKLMYSEEKRTNLYELLSDFISSDQLRTLDIFCDLIIQALLRPFPYGMNNTPVSCQKEYSQNCINAHSHCFEQDLVAAHKLPQYCVLERILSTQLLDDLSIADLRQLYLQIKESSDKNSNFIGCYSRSEIPPYVGELRKNCNETEYEYASRKVWEFLLSLTMKDCSIMITLKPLMSMSSSTAHTENVISDLHGNFYVFSISIADLDSKSLSKVEKVYSDLTFMV